MKGFYFSEYQTNRALEQSPSFFFWSIENEALRSKNPLNYTYYILDAQGNTLSTYDHEVDATNLYYTLKERQIYGSSRLGMNNDEVVMYNSTIAPNVSSVLGNKSYEMSNHLGNVLTVISDVKTPFDTDADLVVDSYRVSIRNISDYSPFGVQLDGRTESSNSYRYGFQGQEGDDEVKGEGNSLNFKYRMHDTRIGRFFVVDPIAGRFAYNSTYAFSENVVIHAIELEGLERVSIHSYSFAPFDSFGGGFHGDGSNRNFNDKINYVMANDKSTNYRIGAKIKVDLTPNASLMASGEEIYAFGAYSYNSGTGETMDDACYSQGYCEKLSNTSVYPKDALLMNWAGYFHNYGGNCDAPTTGLLNPNIDVYMDLNLGLTYGPNTDGYILKVKGNVTGDKFPSNEIFITDETGNKIMLGVSGADPWGPIGELWTNVFTEEQMSNFEIEVKMDENFNFVGVIFGGKTYTLVEWNNKFEVLSPEKVSTNTTTNSDKGTFNTTEN